MEASAKSICSSQWNNKPKFEATVCNKADIRLRRSSIMQSERKKTGSPARSNPVGRREGTAYSMEARAKGRVEARKCAHSSRKVKAMRLTTCRCTRKQEQQNGREAKSHGRAKVVVGAESRSVVSKRPEYS